MAGHNYALKSEGGKRYLLIDYKGSPYGASIADFPLAMKEVIELLQSTDADYVVLADVYDRIYDEAQTAMLKQIAQLASIFRKEGIWNYSRLGGKPCDPFVQNRYKVVAMIASQMLLMDPIQAYMLLLSNIKTEEATLKNLNPEQQECTKVYLETLTFMRNAFDQTVMIQRTKDVLSQLGTLPKDRSIYHTLFESQIKPAFVSSRVFYYTPAEIELIDQYSVADATVNIYKHPEKVQYMYYVDPPEYSLSPEKYFLLTKTREVVSSLRPEGLQHMEPEDVRKYFIGIYETTIMDLANKNRIPVSADEVTKLARVVARYTVGYGMMELLLSDRRLTDVYMDAPLGTKPVYVIHGEYGSCQTNVVFTDEEAKGIVSRFRAQSGRPFDEAHPVLDVDLHDLQTRVAVIGPPLSPDGIAFALRLHKETPWTLPQFVDAKMMNPLAAGMLSFFIDTQASTLVNGSRGSGKTSMLMSLILELIPSLRIIVQEDTLEIPVPLIRKIGYNVQRLKTQSAISVSRTSAEVSPEEALRTALRLGDSVLIVGEVRSTEAKVLYEAMRIGAVGNVVMGTIHGENAYSVWDRIVNDLGVPNTSFKATDIVVTCAPIRFKGSVKRERRLLEITEIGKHWYDDPDREGGLIDLLKFDVKKDQQYIVEENLKKSELFPKISKSRGLSIEDLWKDIYARAEAKKFLVDMKNKYSVPDLLEAVHTVPCNDKWVLILENQREASGKVDYGEANAEWEKWVAENHVKPLIRVKTGGKTK